MNGNRGKRPVEEVFFKWDPQNKNAITIDSSTINGDSENKCGLFSVEDDFSDSFAHKTVRSIREEPPKKRPVKTDGDSSIPKVIPHQVGCNVTQESKYDASHMPDKLHLTKCRDWLGSTTPVSSLKKLDVMDRLSCLIVQPGTLMRCEAHKYDSKDGTTEVQFHRSLYEEKLRKINNSLMIELIRQPIYIRNCILISKHGKQCSCPLKVSIVYPQSPITDRDFVFQRRETTGSNASKQSGILRYFSTGKGNLSPARDSSGTAVTEPARANAHNLFFESFGSVVSPIFNVLNNSSVNQAVPGVISSDAGIVSGSPIAKARVVSQGTASNSCFSTIEAEYSKPDVEIKDILCPFHVGKPLPEIFRNVNGVSGVLEDCNMLYKYEELVVSKKKYHVLYFHKLLSDSAKVWQYALNSKLQVINSVCLRDFELERYATAFELDNKHRKELDDLRKSYLASVYSGMALFIATDTELIIVLMHYNKSTRDSNRLILGILTREKNPGHKFKDIVCHKESGRIFLLATNSLVFEYQYQIGMVPVRDHSYIGSVIRFFSRGCELLWNLVKKDEIYKLYGTVFTGYDVDNKSESKMGCDDDYVNWWDERGNCLDDLSRKVQFFPCSYWPPLRWKELHVSLHESSFSDNSFQEVCSCVSSMPCSISENKTCLRLLNPWDKSAFGLFSIGESSMCIDQERWLFGILNSENGNLTVYKLPSECTFDHFSKAALGFERIFPYNLTVYSLPNSQIVSTLKKMGYFCGAINPCGYKCSKLLQAQAAINDGVDIVLADKFGTRIFVGFALNSYNRLSLSVKGYRVAQFFHFLPIMPSNFGNLPDFTGINMLHSPQRRRISEFSINAFYVRELYLTFETYVGSGNSKVCKVVLSCNEGSSLCQSNDKLPHSLSEEMWRHSQLTDTKTRKFPKHIDQFRSIEWFDDFYLLLDPSEILLSVYGICDKKEQYTSLEEQKDWNLVIVTSQKVYSLPKISLLKFLDALMKCPTSALKCINIPPIINRHGFPLTNFKKSENSDENSDPVKFSGIFDSFEQPTDICGEELKRKVFVRAIYFLCWLYTPEEVFKFFWRYIIDSKEDILNDILLNSEDNCNLLLTSIGIPSKLFEWTAPGCYALDDKGHPTKPVISPWCKFIVFGESKMVRFNCISTNLTSPGIDGLLSLVADMLKPIWLGRIFSGVPLFTSKPYDSPVNLSVPFSPANQLNKSNEFVVGPTFNSDIVLSLTRPVKHVRASLEQIHRLYLFVRKLAENYESISSDSIEKIAEMIARLPLNIQEDIFLEEAHNDNLFSAETNALDFQVLLARLKARHSKDLQTIREIATILEVGQEYLACCLLLHESCILGDVEHEFSKIMADIELMPSKSIGPFSCRDLVYKKKIGSGDPVLSPFSLLGDKYCKLKRPFVMSRQLFHIIANSNLLNLCSNQEFFRLFRATVWSVGGDVSGMQNHFYGHIFGLEGLWIKHWSSVVESQEKHCRKADHDTAASQYAHSLIKFISKKHDTN